MFRRVEAAGVLLDYVNDHPFTLDSPYASATAPGVAFVAVEIDGVTVDAVYVGNGSSHSWWTGAGGKLLPRGLAPGQRLRVSADAACAFRVDWDGEVDLKFKG